MWLLLKQQANKQWVKTLSAHSKLACWWVILNSEKNNNTMLVYSHTLVIERFGSRPNRFSNNKFEIFIFQTSNKNSDHDQTERSRANTNTP